MGWRWAGPQASRSVFAEEPSPSSHHRHILSPPFSPNPVAQLSAKLYRETGTEAVLKVRTSPGLRVTKYMGNFAERADAEADLAGVDSEKAVVVVMVRARARAGTLEGAAPVARGAGRLEAHARPPPSLPLVSHPSTICPPLNPPPQQHDGNAIRENDDLFVQAALLYTTAAGERRVRVHNLRLVASDSVQSVFRHVDVDAVMSVLVRKGECGGGGRPGASTSVAAGTPRTAHPNVTPPTPLQLHPTHPAHTAQLCKPR